MSFTDEDSVERRTKVACLRDYTKTMDVRLRWLRERAANGLSSVALEEALEELDVVREELTVADEELARLEALLRDAYEGRDDQARYFENLFDDAPDGYVVTDVHGVVRGANGTFAAMLGMSPRFFERKPLVSFVHRADVRAFRTALVTLARGEGEGKVLRVGLRPRNKQEPFVAEMNIRAVRGIERRVVELRWSVRKAEARGQGRLAYERGAAGSPSPSPSSGASNE